MRSTWRKRHQVAVPAVVFVVLAAFAWQTPGPGTAMAVDDGRGGGMNKVRVYHNPPLVAVADQPVEVEYDVACTDPEGEVCPAEGSVYVRHATGLLWERFPLRRGDWQRNYRYYAQVPARLVRPDAFQYYARIQAGGRTVEHPSEGSGSPNRVWVVALPGPIELPVESLSTLREPDEVVLSAGWGDGHGELGVHALPDQEVSGPSAFDVASDGTLVVADVVNGRIVRAGRDGSFRTASVAITGGLPDITVGPKGRVHLLESRPPDTGRPLLKTFDHQGKVLRSARIAERIPAMVRMGPDGPYVYQLPAAGWMPVYDALGKALSPVAQLSRMKAGLPVAGGLQVVVKATDEEIRLTRAKGDETQASWRLLRPGTGDGPRFGEVQLFGERGDEIVLVVAVWTETAKVYRVLRLGPDGVREDFQAPEADWAETGAVGRFRLGPDGDLYQLRTAPSGAQIVRYALGGETS